MALPNILSKGKFSVRPGERRLAFIAAVLVSCWVIISLLLQPSWDHVRRLQGQIESAGQKLEAIRDLLAGASKVRQRHALLTTQLNLGDGTDTQRTLLGELESLARQSGVQINLKPRPMKQDGMFTRFDIEFDLEGSQANSLGFVDALIRMPRVFTVERLRMVSVPAQSEASVRTNIVIQSFTLQPSAEPTSETEAKPEPNTGGDISQPQPQPQKS